MADLKEAHSNIVQVTKYRAPDGKEFHSKEVAEQYWTTQRLNNLVDEIVMAYFNQPEQMKRTPEYCNGMRKEIRDFFEYVCLPENLIKTEKLLRLIAASIYIAAAEEKEEKKE